MGMAGGDAQGALETAEAVGRANFAAVPLAPHEIPLVMPRNAAVRRLQTEGSQANVWKFRHGAFPDTPMDLPGGHWVEFRRHWLEK